MTVLNGNIAEEVPTVEVAEAMVDNVPMLLSGHVDVVDTLAAGVIFLSNCVETFLLLLPHSAAAPLVKKVRANSLHYLL